MANEFEDTDVTGSLGITGEIVLDERADHISTPVAARGILWAKNTTPTTLMFTDDAGTDVTLGAAGATFTAATINGQTEATPVSGDYVIGTDTSDGGALKKFDVSNFLGGGGGGGDVVGPASSVDNRLVRFDGTTGKLVQDGTIVQDDSGNLSGVGTLNTHTIPGGTGTLALTSNITGTNSGTNTGDQTITLTGDVTGSGTGSFAATIAAGAVDIAMLSATGTPSSSTYLRGDNTWATPAGSGAVDSVNGATGVVVLDADDIDDTSTTNKFTTAAEISKLAGVESGATADQTDAEIETAYNNQVSVVAQAEAEAGSATTVRRWTALRVAQAIAALAPGVTLAGTPNYLTIAGQVITRALIDLTSHVTGRLPLANIATFAQATIAGRADAAGTGDITALTAAQVRTIINVADGADVSTVTASNTITFTNKRITARVGTTTSSATPTINTDNYDLYIITAQAVDITSLTTNLSGTPTTGQWLDIWITGTAARAITAGASFGSGAATFPSTTVTTKTLYIRNVWDGSIWRCMAAESNP